MVLPDQAVGLVITTVALGTAVSTAVGTWAQQRRASRERIGVPGPMRPYR